VNGCDLLDAVESAGKAEKAMGREFSFPLPEMGLAAGFFFILLLEQTIIYANEKQWISGGMGDRQHLLHQHHHSSTEESQIRQGRANEGEVAEEEEDTHFDPESHSTVRVILLVFALSLHAVFEGLSVGLLTDVAVLLQV